MSSRQRARAVGLLLALALVAPAAPAVAHPHVFVEHRVTALVGPEGLEGVQLAWTFDEMFSSMIVLTFDTDKDGTISPREAKAIEHKHLANLKEFNYFVTLKLNDRPVSAITVKDFQVRGTREAVTYVFTVPVKAAEGTLEIVVDDPTYYSAFTLNPKAPAAVQAPRNYRAECRAIRGSGAEPEVVRCTLRRQGA